MNLGLHDRARDLALMMTRWPSITGSARGSRFACACWWSGWGLTGNGWRRFPGMLRAAAMCLHLKRGRSRRTVVLTGHFDVVSIEDYGPLLDLAFEPEAACWQLPSRG